MKKTISTKKKEALSEKRAKAEEDWILSQTEKYTGPVEGPVYLMREKQRLEDKLKAVSDQMITNERERRYAPTTENIKRLESDIRSLDMSVRDLMHRVELGKTCENCLGSGFVKYLFEPRVRCVICSGTGREKKY